MASGTSLSFDLGLAQDPQYVGSRNEDTPSSTQVYADLKLIINAVRKLAIVIDAYTGRATTSSSTTASSPSSLSSKYTDILYAVASVDIPQGAACYTRMVDDTLTAYLAQADAASTFCTGFCTSPTGGTAGSLVAIKVGAGLLTGIGSLTEGVPYYLSPSNAGYITSVKPTDTGQYVQPLGYALYTNCFYFLPNIPVAVAA